MASEERARKNNPWLKVEVVLEFEREERREEGGLAW